MQHPWAKLRHLRDWWFRVCTGHDGHGLLDEELYRQRILVMTSSFWLITVVGLQFIVPLLIELSPEGSAAADILFVLTGFGVLTSMLILRYLHNRIMALNVMLLIFSAGFSASCFIFGGTASPTYPMLLLIPVMAGIVGSSAVATFWGLAVLIFWAGILAAERSGFEFLQIIRPQNHNFAMMIAYAAMAVAVVIVILIYAEMNRSLRMSLQSANRELAHLSTHDQLTGLPNRRFYDARCAQALQRAAEHDSMMGLIVLDLNDFKRINDTHGHGAGDKLLIAVAQRLQSTLRETDLIARLGGDEFAAVVEDVDSAEQLTRIAHKLSQAIEQPVMVRQLELRFGASIGVAIFPIDGRQKQELEEQADRAMYHAKKRGLPVALSSLESKTAPYPVRQHNQTA